jgi:hypothetical protein
MMLTEMPFGVLILGSAAYHLTYICSGPDVQPNPQLIYADMRAAGV